MSFPLVGNLSKMSAGMKKTHPCTPLKRGLRRILYEPVAEQVGMTEKG